MRLTCTTQWMSVNRSISSENLQGRPLLFLFFIFFSSCYSFFPCHSLFGMFSWVISLSLNCSPSGFWNLPGYTTALNPWTQLSRQGNCSYGLPLWHLSWWTWPLRRLTLSLSTRKRHTCAHKHMRFCVPPFYNHSVWHTSFEFEICDFTFTRQSLTSSPLLSPFISGHLARSKKSIRVLMWMSLAGVPPGLNSSHITSMTPIPWVFSHVELLLLMSNGLLVADLCLWELPL